VFWAKGGKETKKDFGRHLPLTPKKIHLHLVLKTKGGAYSVNFKKERGTKQRKKRVARARGGKKQNHLGQSKNVFRI